MATWHKEETYRSMIQISVSALRFVIIANGGAAIALLALVGDLYPGVRNIEGLQLSMYAFLGGVVLGGLAHVTAYKTQLTLYNEKSTELGRTEKHVHWLNWSIGLVVLGIGCFGIGSVLGISGLFAGPCNA